MNRRIIGMILAVVLIGIIGALGFYYARHSGYLPPTLASCPTDKITDKLKMIFASNKLEGTFTNKIDHDGMFLYLENEPVLVGSELQSAKVSWDYRYEGAVIYVQMKPETAKKFEAGTGKNIGNYLAIILDGKVTNAPRIMSAIAGGSAQISVGIPGDKDSLKAANDYLQSMCASPLEK